jgi:hypothetical protein
LVRHYIALTREIGVGRGFTDLLSDAKATPPHEASAPSLKDPKQWRARIENVATALLVRGATSELRALFDHDDPDIRVWTGGLFRDLDPEVADAAVDSVFKAKSTRELLALWRLARRLPPTRPTLKEMSDDALVARFEDAAVRRSAANFLNPVKEPQDLETQNRITGEMINLTLEMKTRGLLPRLAPLMGSPDLTVRRFAAQGCLRLAEKEAVAALESVVANGSFDERIRAEDVLAGWRKGNCLVDKSPRDGMS